jgi:hypothetical protein
MNASRGKWITPVFHGDGLPAGNTFRMTPKGYITVGENSTKLCDIANIIDGKGNIGRQGNKR